MSSAPVKGGLVPPQGLNATAASLLGFLHERPMTGWDLVATAQAVIGDFWSLTQSQVYRELTAMSAAGLVEPGERGSRAKRPYEITPAGRAAFAEWIRREPTSEIIRFPLLLTVAFGRHLPPELLGEFLARHRKVHEGRLRDYETQHEPAAGTIGDRFALATLDFGLRYERAVLAWFDALPGILSRATGLADGEASESGREPHDGADPERTQYGQP